MVEYLKSKRVRRLVIVGSQIGTLEQWIHEIKDLLPPEIAVVGFHSLLADERDFGALLAKVKRESPEALALFLLAAQARGFILRARAMQVDVPVIGPATLNDETFVSLFRDIGPGPIIVDFHLDSTFRDRLKKLAYPPSHVTEVGQGYLLFKLLAHMASTTAPRYATDDLMLAAQAFPAGVGPVGGYAVRHVMLPNSAGTWIRNRY